MKAMFAFGDFVVDVDRHELYHGGRPVGLGERTFRVLELLLQNAGRVVTRQRLIDTVWDDTVVTDDSLARAVSDLRAALGDSSSEPTYIRTVHRQGYLFVAPVRAVDTTEPWPIPETRGGRRMARYAAAVAAAAALLVVAALALRWLGTRPHSPVDAPLPELASWRLRALGPSPFAATAIKPSFAKTSELLAVVAPDPETSVHSLFLLRPDGGEPLQLTRGIEVRGPSPEFAADDSHILFTVYRSDPELGLVPDVWAVPLPAGAANALIWSASAASTSPDTRAMVYAAVEAGGTSIRVRREDGSEHEVARRGFWPRWSPDGRWIAYTTSDPEGGQGTIHVVRPDGSEDRRLTSTPSQHYGLGWTPDASRVLFASTRGGPTTLWVVDVDGHSLREVTRGPGICTSPTMSPGGRRLVFSFSHRRWYLHLAPRVDAPTRRVLVAPGVQAAALSPDGLRVALVEGAEGQSPAVSVLDLDSMSQRTITGMAASTVAWMPDGASLLIAAPAPDGARDWVWRLRLDGGLPEPILAGGEHWRWPVPSPEGSTIAALRRSDSGWDLVLRSLTGGVETVLAHRPEIEAPRWSPDGRLVAWSGSQRPEDVASGGIWVCAASGGSPRRLASDGAWPVWDESGTHLLFARFLHRRGIWRVGLTGGLPQLVRALDAEMEGLYLEGLDIGGGGGPVLFTLSTHSGELYAMEPPPQP